MKRSERVQAAIDGACCTELEEYIARLEKENAALAEREGWLLCLEAAGVDNWEGWDEARKIQKEPIDD